MNLVIRPRNRALQLQIPTGLWLGTEDSLQRCMSLVMGAPARIAELHSAGYGPDQQEEEDADFGDYSYMLEKVGSVAVLSVVGDLMTNESFWHRYFGMTSYQAVTNAAITAAQNRDITSILLRVDSPGGTANGIDDCLNSLREIAKNRVPIYAYVAGCSCSAAYWLSSVAAKIYINQLSMCGSIGALMAHTSMYRYLVTNGIDPEIIRSAEYKAIGHPLERLSDNGREHLQNQINYLGDVFSADVAKNRKRSVEAIKALKAREFYGEQAIKNGLADEIVSFESVIHRLNDPTALNMMR